MRLQKCMAFPESPVMINCEDQDQEEKKKTQNKQKRKTESAPKYFD